MPRSISHRSHPRASKRFHPLPHHFHLYQQFGRFHAGRPFCWSTSPSLIYWSDQWIQLLIHTSSRLHYQKRLTNSSSLFHLSPHHFSLSLNQLSIHVCSKSHPRRNVLSFVCTLDFEGHNRTSFLQSNRLPLNWCQNRSRLHYAESSICFYLQMFLYYKLQ